jgi:hypothetical protein
MPRQGQKVFEIYKSRWLLEKEAAMPAHLEKQRGNRLLPDSPGGKVTRPRQ